MGFQRKRGVIYRVKTSDTTETNVFFLPILFTNLKTATQNVIVHSNHFVADRGIIKIYILSQIVAQGNILIGDELEMISRHKTFAVALSREMVPTARIVVYYLQTTPEEMVVDTLNFFVNGTRNNIVSNTSCDCSNALTLTLLSFENNLFLLWLW